MNEPQNRPSPPQQPSPQGPGNPSHTEPQWQGPPQYQGDYQDRYQGGYGHPPAPGNNPHWAHQDQHRGGYSAHYGSLPGPGYYPPGYGAAPAGYPYYPAYAPPPAYAAYPAHNSGFSSFFNFRDERFVKGAITGAALTFLLTNDTVQKNGIKTLVKVWSLFQSGFEEIKERFQDAEAEVKTETQPH